MGTGQGVPSWRGCHGHAHSGTHVSAFGTRVPEVALLPGGAAVPGQPLVQGAEGGRHQPEPPGCLTQPRSPRQPGTYPRAPVSGFARQACFALRDRGGERGGGQRGGRGGAVLWQGPHSPGCLRHLSLHARPKAQVSSSGRGTKGQVTNIPMCCSPLVHPKSGPRHPPQCPPSPQPHIPPCHAAPSALVCPLGPARPSRPAPPGPPRLGMQVGSGSGCHGGGGKGEKGLSTAPSAPPGTSPPAPDGWTDRQTEGRCLLQRPYLGAAPASKARDALGVAEGQHVLRGAGVGVGVRPPQPQPRGLTRTHPIALLAFGAGRAWDAQTRVTLNTKGSSLEQRDWHHATARGCPGGLRAPMPSPGSTHTGTSLSHIALGARRPFWSWEASVTLQQMKCHHQPPQTSLFPTV